MLAFGKKYVRTLRSDVGESLDQLGSFLTPTVARTSNAFFKFEFDSFMFATTDLQLGAEKIHTLLDLWSLILGVASDGEYKNVSTTDGNFGSNTNYYCFQ